MHLKQKIFTTLLGAVLGIQLATVYSEKVDKCLEGPYFKKKPSAETGSDYVECKQWKDWTCCPGNITEELRDNGVKNLYHFDWDHCGNMSEACKKFTRNDACFYQCDPNLTKFSAKTPFGISQIPVCSDFCDDWFEACKNDKTFKATWTNELNPYATEVGPKYNDSQCRTFDKFFKNGEDLCNTHWKPLYKYERSSNCFVFDFNGTNPNDKVTKGLGNSITPSTLILFVVLVTESLLFLTPFKGL